MNLISLLPWRRKPRLHCAPPPGAAVSPALDGDGDGDGDDRPRACGWFDSSHDLQHGLSVHEHASPDTLARELPLAHWLDLQLWGWRASAPLTHQT